MPKVRRSFTLSEETTFVLDFLKDADNWLKGILADEIAIRFLFDRFLPEYHIFQFSGEFTSSSVWILKYQRVKPSRLWLHRFEGDFSKREPDDESEKALHELHKEEGKFLEKVFMSAPHSTFDYLGIREIGSIKKCLIDVKCSKYNQIKLSKNQKEITPEALERGYEIFFVNLIFLENWNMKSRLLKLQPRKS